MKVSYNGCHGTVRFPRQRAAVHFVNIYGFLFLYKLCVLIRINN
jgi:hypothetical protein